MLHIWYIGRLFLNWKKYISFLFLLNTFCFSVYLLFHNIYQNGYFSGKIKQKPFSEVMQYYSNTVTSNTVFYLLCHNIFQNHITVTITFYNNSFVTYQNSTFSGLTRNTFLDRFFPTRKCANWIKIPHTGGQHVKRACRFVKICFEMSSIKYITLK